MSKDVHGKTPPRARPRRLVLVADDEPFIGATLVEILQGEGFDALCVSDGESGLFWSRAARPDYIISDIIMPKMNGIEFAKAVLADHPGTKIILFSGQAGSLALLEQAQREGWKFEVLSKPIRPQVLLDKLRS